MYRAIAERPMYRPLPRRHPRTSFEPFLRTFPLDIFLYLIQFLPQRTLKFYVLLCRAVEKTARRRLYADVTLSTSLQVKALKNTLMSDPSLREHVRILRLASRFAAICLPDCNLFPQLEEIVYPKDWMGQFWNFYFRPKEREFMLTNLTIQSIIELDRLIQVISSIDSLTSLSCDEISFHNPCTVNCNEIKCTLKFLCIGIGADVSPIDEPFPANKLLSLVGKSVETLKIITKGVQRIRNISLASLSNLRRCVIRWDIGCLPDNVDAEDSLAFLLTLQSRVFDACVIILPLIQDRAELYKSIARDLTKIPAYVDMIFGTPDPASPLGPLWKMTVLKSQVNKNPDFTQFGSEDKAMFLYLGNQFDNREISGSLSLPKTKSVVTAIIRPFLSQKKISRHIAELPPSLNVMHLLKRLNKWGYESLRGFVLELCIACWPPAASCWGRQLNSRLKSPSSEELISIWLSLSHPHVSPMLGITKAARHRVISPWMGYTSVRRAIARMAEKQPQNLFPSITTWLEQIMSAISYLHSQRIIHKNINSNHICIDDDGGALVVYSFDAMSLRSTPENASLGASESWRVHVPHYKADVVAFRSLCDEASDHTTDGVFALSYLYNLGRTTKLVGGTCNQEWSDISPNPRWMKKEKDRQDQYDDWMRTIICLANERARANSTKAIRDSKKKG